MLSMNALQLVHTRPRCPGKIATAYAPGLRVPPFEAAALIRGC